MEFVMSNLATQYKQTWPEISFHTHIWRYRDLHTHHCTLYNHVGWSSLTERRELHWHLYLYKAILGDCPKYISVFLEWAPAGPYLTRSSGFPPFKVPTVNSDFGRTAFSFCGPTTWNNLQETLKLTTLIPLNRFRSLVTKPNEICHCF